MKKPHHVILVFLFVVAGMVASIQAAIADPVPQKDLPIYTIFHRTNNGNYVNNTGAWISGTDSRLYGFSGSTIAYGPNYDIYAQTKSGWIQPQYYSSSMDNPPVPSSSQNPSSISGNDDQGDVIASTLCIITKALKGPIGKAVATIAIVVLGIGLFLGKLSWPLAVATAIGIGLIFGSSEMVTWVSGKDISGCS